jgi:hypothetical protein
MDEAGVLCFCACELPSWKYQVIADPNCGDHIADAIRDDCPGIIFQTRRA